MSGIEVASLVLGAIPLLIAALEHYHGLLKSYKRLWNMSEEVSELIDTIKTQEIVYRCTLIEFYGPVLGHSETADLVSDAKTKEWQKPLLEQRMRGYYQVNFDAYRILLHRIHASFQNLSKIVDDNLSAEAKARAHFATHFVGVKFMVHRSTRNAALHLFKESIQAFRDQHQRDINISRNVSRWNTAGSMRRSRNALRTLHNVIKADWECSCPNGHDVYVELDELNASAPVSQAARKKLLVASAAPCSDNTPAVHDLTFELTDESAEPPKIEVRSVPAVHKANFIKTALSASASMSGSKTTTPTHDSVSGSGRKTAPSTRTLVKDARMTHEQTSDLAAAKSTPTAGLASSSKAQGKLKSSFRSYISSFGASKPRKSAVRFDSAQRQTTACKSHETRNGNSAILIAVCKAIDYASGDQSRYVGCLEDAEEQRYIHLYSQGWRSTSLLPLRSIWEHRLHTVSTQGGKYATLPSKVRVAITLASCLLQYHSTSWLGDGWCQKHVRICPLSESNSSPSTSCNMLIYIKRQYARQVHVPQITAGDLRGASQGYNAEVFALGVALLELIHEVSFQSMVEQEFPGGANVHSFYLRMIAMEWIQKIPEEHPLRKLCYYDKIVEHCINCDFDGGLNVQNSSWENDRVWETFYATVVAPLANSIRDIK